MLLCRYQVQKFLVGFRRLFACVLLTSVGMRWMGVNSLTCLKAFCKILEALYASLAAHSWGKNCSLFLERDRLEWHLCFASLKEGNELLHFIAPLIFSTINESYRKVKTVFSANREANPEIWAAMLTSLIWFDLACGWITVALTWAGRDGWEGCEHHGVPSPGCWLQKQQILAAELKWVSLLTWEWDGLEVTTWSGIPSCSTLLLKRGS